MYLRFLTLLLVCSLGRAEVYDFAKCDGSQMWNEALKVTSETFRSTCKEYQDKWPNDFKIKKVANCGLFRLELFCEDNGGNGIVNSIVITPKQSNNIAPSAMTALATGLTSAMLREFQLTCREVDPQVIKNVTWLWCSRKAMPGEWIIHYDKALKNQGSPFYSMNLSGPGKDEKK